MVPSACAAGKTWDGTWREDGSGSGRWNMGHTHGLPGPFRTIAALRPDQRGSKRTRGPKDDSNARPPVPSTKRATRLPYYLPGECAVSHISHLPSLLLTLSRPCLPRRIISLCLRQSTSNEQPITFLCQTWAWPALKETPSTPDQTRPDQTRPDQTRPDHREIVTSGPDRHATLFGVTRHQLAVLDPTRSPNGNKEQDTGTNSIISPTVRFHAIITSHR
ncbi:hypothetical protein VFPPC_17420 [Pochonia chlamydosporia 170]|uniref:Uncharacterized protein n=1 Tax=Pochonia chlamydosporia 170 TaxID=1380566 RepID=A0A219ARM6_METCM|nr:hypothetical protein VFPPC_17420 [Pochonia chlamydosporia 170]OWT43431.1 hypothetical protein VFPPC_17420 [Pochonia chlamydosporia 170]